VSDKLSNLILFNGSEQGYDLNLSIRDVGLSARDGNLVGLELDLHGVGCLNLIKLLVGSETLGLNRNDLSHLR